jgi:hypothetical protein
VTIMQVTHAELLAEVSGCLPRIVSGRAQTSDRNRPFRERAPRCQFLLARPRALITLREMIIPHMMREPKTSTAHKAVWASFRHTHWHSSRLVLQ